MPLIVNVHVFVLLPLLEHAPDQKASRLFETLSVIEVPAAKDADPVLPTGTFSPEGVELTVSPLRPLAVSVSVAVPVVVEELDGFTRSAADFVTPPPDTEIVTGVSTETDDVKILKPPRVVPAGTIMPFGTDATAGLLLATWNIVSVGCDVAIDTVAKELPPSPTVEDGSSEIAVGATAGRSVTCADAPVPFHVAVTVAVVVIATLFVWSGNDAEKLPASTNTDGGGVTAGESLDNATIAPPGGA